MTTATDNISLHYCLTRNTHSLNSTDPSRLGHLHSTGITVSDRFAS